MWWELNGWLGAEVELSVVCIGMETDTLLVDNLTNGENVHDKQDRAKH